MATLEMVEKLRQRANVSYDEAKAALDACGDDLLEAMIYLERQRKANPPSGGGCYSTEQGHAEPGGAGEGCYAEPPRHASFGQTLERFWQWLCKVVDKGNTNNFEIWREDQRILSLPVTVLVVLAVFCFYVVVPLLIVGLFFSCKYRFSGPDLSRSQANSVMDTAARAADDLKREVMQKNAQDGEQREDG